MTDFRHFEISEFDCQCENCGGENEMDYLFIAALDRARESAATAFVITSGYRCPQHPLTIARPNSAHADGLAADIATPDSHTRFLVLRSLIEHGFTRIGIGEDFVHVDAAEHLPRCVAWDYYD